MTDAKVAHHSAEGAAVGVRIPQVQYETPSNNHTLLTCGSPLGVVSAHVFCNEQRRSPGLGMVSTMPFSGQSRPSKDEPPAHVTCPKCQNPKAVIAYTRHNKLMCFCSGCAYGWDMLKPASGSPPFSSA